MSRRAVLIPLGSVFGRLIVVGHTTIRGRQACECLCECGASHVVAASDLRLHRTQSCGCLNAEKRKTSNLVHGDSKKRLFHIWAQMIERCRPGHVQAKNYGDRGIRVCRDWQNYEAFREWALSNGYTDELTIERIDVNGNYCPANCTWVTRVRQGYNKRATIRVTVGKITRCLAEWCKAYHVNYHTAVARIKRGWTADRLFDSPVTHVSEPKVEDAR